MPAHALVIRYPNGDYEYDFTRRDLPGIGDTVRRKGELWRVTRVVGDGAPTAYVERVEQRVEQTQHSPPRARG